MTQLKVILEKDGQFKVTGEKFQVGSAGIQPSLRAVTEDELRLTHAFIGEAPDQLRQELADFSCMFISADSSKIPEVKERIKKFRRSLAKFMDEGKRDQSFILAVNLVPLAGWRG